MKALALLLTVFLFTVQIASAQETSESADWITEQRCITAPSQPPDGWTYNGVIFTFKQGDGVHARRADVATPYYIAFDSDSEFGVAGSFSPDGRWFAVLEGGTERVNLLYNHYFFDEIRVYSTSPFHSLYRIPMYNSADGSVQQGILPTIQWLDNEHFITYGYVGGDPHTHYVSDVSGYVVNPFTGEIVPLEQSRPEVPPALAVPSEFEHYIADYMAQLPVNVTELSIKLTPTNQIGVFQRDGHLSSVESADLWLNYPVSDDRILAFGAVDALSTIHIADFATRTITDTCIQTPYKIALSPDGRQLAFGLEPAGYVYILDMEAWETYRIDLAAADVVGWYPIE